VVHQTVIERSAGRRVKAEPTLPCSCWNGLTYVDWNVVLFVLRPIFPRDLVVSGELTSVINCIDPGTLKPVLRR